MLQGKLVVNSTSDQADNGPAGEEPDPESEDPNQVYADCISLDSGVETVIFGEAQSENTTDDKRTATDLLVVEYCNRPELIQEISQSDNRGISLVAYACDSALGRTTDSLLEDSIQQYGEIYCESAKTAILAEASLLREDIQNFKNDVQMTEKMKIALDNVTTTLTNVESNVDERTYDAAKALDKASKSFAEVLASAVNSICVASLDGSQEVPPVDTEGTGSATITFDASNRQLTWSIDFSELSGPATAAHFHGPASAETNAGIQINIGEVSGLVSPMNGSAVLSQEQVDFLLQDQLYINIHTESNTGGEIRGEVSCNVPPSVEWQTIALVMGDEQLELQYMISGGALNGLIGNPESKTITATIAASEEGELTIQLPRNVIDSVDGNGDDSDYNVLVDGAEEGDTADDFGEEIRTLIIPFAADSEQIDIVGT